MNKNQNMENIIYNLIIKLYDDNINEFNGIEDEEFINYVCEECGLSKEMYKKIMF